MGKLFNVSSSPHVRSKHTTQAIMFDVAIAMLPASIYGVWQFGMHALLVLIATVVSCVLSEYIFEKLMKKPITVYDGSALGQNWMNPALAARCFLLISFAGKMTTFTEPFSDAVASATPMAMLKAGEQVDVTAMFIGRIPGTIGEVSVIALLIGAAYLVFRKVITLRIPLTYIATVAIFAAIYSGFNVSYILAHVCGGGLIFGAFFMATDYVTSPITPKGQFVFGIALGLLTGLFRIFGGSAEGVSYAIIFCNILVPLIEKFTLPTAFGKKGGKK